MVESKVKYKMQRGNNLHPIMQAAESEIFEWRLDYVICVLSKPVKMQSLS